MLAKRDIAKKDFREGSTHPASSPPRMSGEMRHEKIIDAAVQLFAEHGFSGTTTKEIAVVAGISEGSLFQHFKTKAELYTEILERKSRSVYERGWMDEISELIARRDDEGVFRTIAMKIGEHCRTDPNFIRLMLFTALEKHKNAQPFRRRMLYPVFELLKSYIQTRTNEQAFRECSAEAAAFAFISTQIYYAMGNVLFQSKMLSLGEEEAVSNFIKLSLDALRCNGEEKDFSRSAEK